MNPESLIRIAAARQAGIDSRGLPKPATKRKKSVNELMAKYKSPGTGIYFCLHDKSYYEICSKCRRTKREALANLLSL